ncbi:hypothetical protein [Psychrobacter sp. P11G5]|uniref:hypothetical protein n=1 Tax=Psychrobacter sp. P11G5 TaxID=1699624 RepID=UPI000AAB89A0|nr:hypothetical protein [Psychrobacter sp. P11G5]
MINIFLITLFPIPFPVKTRLYHDKNEYANANSLRERMPVIPHNGGISYIE